jgi:heavy metal sensor kinase
MSLRLRLILLYTALLGSVLLLFGGLVYGLTNLILINQVDQSLTSAAQELLKVLKVGPSGIYDSRSVAGFQPAENLLFQVWGNDQRLQISRPTGWKTPLDSQNRFMGETTLVSVYSQDQHLRVLTLPLESIRGPAGVLQVAINLNLVDLIQQTLSTILIILTLVAMAVSSILVWVFTARATQPLATMTRVATQITNADDLSRRIPLENPSNDEVGKLVTAFNQTLERLERLFTSQQRFLGDVSHELRTPLTVIKGNIGLIRRMGTPDEESLSSIESEVDRLSRLVGDLLLVNQAESGMLPLNLDRVQLDEVILEVLQQMHVLAGERKNLVLGEIEHVQIKGDRDRIKQVFVNLVSNAIAYTPNGSTIDLEMRKMNGNVQVTISDNGPGISAQDLPHIFDRFYRGEKSRKRNAAGGSGLGLSIARYIVVKHGGTIEVVSEEGKGTTFIVQLPILEE